MTMIFDLIVFLVIGLVAACFSAVGIAFGDRFLRRWGRGAEALGGCALVLIGVRIVLAHECGLAAR